MPSSIKDKNNDAEPEYRELQRRLRDRLVKERGVRVDIDDVLREERSVWRVLFDNSRDGIVVINTKGEVVDANPAFARMLGYPLQEIYGLSVWDWDAEFDRQHILGLLAEVEGEGTYFETRHRRKDGSVFDVELSNSSVIFTGEKLVFSIGRDVSERKENERLMRQLVSTDALTGLLNRRELSDRLSQELERLRRSPGHLSLILFDIDFFKKINDRFGHAAGDQALIRVSRSAHNLIRSTDSLARWGGEEFLLLLPDTDLTAALAVAEKIRSAIERSAADSDTAVTASFGVTQALPGDKSTSFIRRADQAMYEAKRAGRNCVRSVAADSKC
ncbi:MAG: diguanylate cyclase [Pseudomonadota bacterium]|nr:diguanylate cyclase [Pseudomonadota bacterium]